MHKHARYITTVNTRLCIPLIILNNQHIGINIFLFYLIQKHSY